MESAQYHPCEVGEKNYLHMCKARPAKWSAHNDKEAHSKRSKTLSPASQGQFTTLWPPIYQSSQLRIFSLSFANNFWQKKAWKTEC